MRIAIDLSILDTPYLTGVEKVQRAVVRELTLLDADNEYLLVSRRKVRLPFELPGNFRQIDLERENPSYLWRERLLPDLFRKEKVELFHSPVSAIPVLGRLPKIATVHEVPWVERNRQSEPIRRGHRVWLFLNTRYARFVVAVSERTRQNILALYPDAEQKVRVVHHGVDDVFHAPYQGPSRAEFLAPFGIPDRPFLLFVGTLRRKKNLRALLDAYARLPARVRDGCQLVLAGVRNVSFHDLDRRVAELGLEADVHFPGYVRDEDLVHFYHHAEALVYPSLYEGFGLPPLEAMASGTPVVASSGGAIPEVVGDAAALVDPTDPTGFAEALERVLVDREHAASLREKGFARVKKFRWRQTALELLDLWQEAVSTKERAAP